MSLPTSVLFLCTGNSCRSQMAEGWARDEIRDFVDTLPQALTPPKADSEAKA